MTNAKDKQIRESLEDAGVARYAFKHTLKKLDRVDLHDWITQEDYMREDDTMTSFIVAPSSTKAMAQARLTFYVMAKTMLLNRQSVICVPLVNFAKACTGRWDELDDSLYAAEYVYITDFCEKGSPAPLSPYDSAMVRSRIRGMIEGQEQGVAILSEVRRDSLDKSGWWGEGFRQWIADNFQEMLVKESEK